MTWPRASGWTRTARTEPRRGCLSRTSTSSGLSTTPRTRCSRASASMRSGLGGLGGLGLVGGDRRGLRRGNLGRSLGGLSLLSLGGLVLGLLLGLVGLLLAGARGALGRVRAAEQPSALQ